jgi:multiple sugar transport system ATP-binding protein
VTEQGTVKARVPSGMPVHVGETVGLAFRFSTLSLFDAQTGLALQTASQPPGHEESAAHG